MLGSLKKAIKSAEEMQNGDMADDLKALLWYLELKQLREKRNDFYNFFEKRRCV